MRRTSPLLLITALAVAACSSQPTVEVAPGSSADPTALRTTGSFGEPERYASITRAGAPFYRHGPAQPSGPDLRLNRGDLVKVLRRESGFSQVQLEAGQLGYIGNGYLADAPAPPPPAVENVTTVETIRAVEVADVVEITETRAEASRPSPPPSTKPAFRLGTSQEAEAPSIRFR